MTDSHVEAGFPEGNPGSLKCADTRRMKGLRHVAMGRLLYQDKNTFCGVCGRKPPETGRLDAVGLQLEADGWPQALFVAAHICPDCFQPMLDGRVIHALHVTLARGTKISQCARGWAESDSAKAPDTPTVEYAHE